MSGPLGSSQWMYASGDYEINQSLKFEGDDSHYLKRTPGSAGNRRTFTWSAWIKRGNHDATHMLFFTSPAGDLTEDDHFGIRLDSGSSSNIVLTWGDGNIAVTDAIFRDVTSWYHIVVAIDTTQGTDTNRVKVYVNGTQQTFSSTDLPSQNHQYGVSNTQEHNIGSRTIYGSSGNYYSGYMAEVHFIDGTALAASSFGETDPTYGHWKPIEYEGSHGTQGWYLPFDDASAIGDDESANTNDWTPVNYQTDGRDIMKDSPTTNFATLSAIDKKLSHGGTVNEGGLRFVNDGNDSRRGTLGAISGKWYAEFCPQTTVNGSNPIMFGIMGLNGKVDHDNMERAAFIYSDNGGNHGIHYNEAGSNGTDNVSDLVNIAVDDVLQLAWDMDSGKVWVGRNNTWLSSGDPANGSNPAHTMATTGNNPMTIGCDHAGVSYQVIINTGSDSSFNGGKTAQGNSDGNGVGDFYYTPPSGFLALCQKNLANPGIVPGDHFNIVTYSGNDADDRSITGVGFQPDWVWLKSRSNGLNHYLYDVIRGANYQLITNDTGGEANTADRMQAFESDGFQLGTSNEVNGSSRTYVAWNWKGANGTATDTNGSINSTVSANTAAGFSVVGYAGDGGVDTIGHGLTQAPELIIIKNRTDDDTNWNAWHHKLSTNESFALNSDNGESANGQYFFGDNTNLTAPTSTVFTVGNNAQVNAASKNYIAYCWHSVEGYSKVGFHTGNANEDGPFVYTGFRPAWVMIKNADDTQHWKIHDNKRDPHNLVHHDLNPNESGQEGSSTSNSLDFCATGFKIRAVNSAHNGNGHNIVWLAFAETPAKYANAR